MAEQKAQEKQEEKPQEKPEGKLGTEEERVKMLAEGTKPSDIKTVETGTPPPPPPTPVDTPPADKDDRFKVVAGPERVITVPKGVSLVEEPRIVSEGGLLHIELREVSTGGVKHFETEPTSRTPPSPDEPSVPATKPS